MKMTQRTAACFATIAAIVSMLSACGTDDGANDGAADVITTNDTAVTDVGSDANATDVKPHDGGSSDAVAVDVGPVDTGAVDTGAVDAGPVDVGSDDAGNMTDAGPADAGPADVGLGDAGNTIDAGPADAGPADAGPADAGPADAGPADAGPADAGPADAGPADAGSVDAGNATDAGADTIVVGPNGCSAEVPCKKAQCFKPGQSMGCGMCQKPMNACQSDSQCKPVGGKPGICEYRKSDCTCGGEKLCHAGCLSDNECAVGLACDAQNHCSPKPCSTTSPCPALFACSAAVCKRKTCKASAACSGGVCVNGQCFQKPGFCSFPPP